MPTTPFLGPAYSARSTNLADQKLINLYMEIMEGAPGRSAGAFYATPGLDYLATCGLGPILAVMPFNNLLYVVSNTSVYSVNVAFVVTFVGTIANNVGISFANNEFQLIFTDTTNLYMLPAGFPVTGGSVGAPGTEHQVGDILTMAANDGFTVGTLQVTVATISGTGVASFTVTASGSFPTEPTGFTQASTSGSGSGFTITSPTYGSLGIYTVPLPFSQPLSITYQDSFGLIAQNGTETLWQSVAGDLSLWPALNFKGANAQPGNIFAIQSQNDQVWVVKEKHTQIFVFAGLNGFAFQNLAGTLIEHGTCGPYSLTSVGDSLGCVSQDENGRGVIVLSEGYTWVRISTSAIEHAMSEYPTIIDAIGFSYQQEGHLFFVVIFPSGDATWVYDVTASADAKVPVWGQRAAFLNGQFHRHWMNCFSTFGANDQFPIVGDYRNGNLYALNLDTQLDNFTRRKWLRSWRALGKGTMKPVRFPPLFIDMEAGIGVPDVPQFSLTGGGTTFTAGSVYAVGDTIILVGNVGVTISDPVICITSIGGGGAVGTWELVSPGLFLDFRPTAFTQGATSGSGSGFILTITNAGTAYTQVTTDDPQLMLRWSDDGGHNYSGEYFASAGKTGETGHRVQYTRLGSTKRGHGLDRTFELSSADAFTVGLIGADLGED